jgi:methyl-accepting chemotaxis protein
MGIFGTIGSLTKKINGNDGGNNPMSILLSMMGIAASGQMLIQDTIDMVSGKNKKDIVIPPPPQRPDFTSNFNELISSQQNLSSNIKGSINNINKPIANISTRTTNISDSISQHDPINNIKSELPPE